MQMQNPADYIERVYAGVLGNRPLLNGAVAIVCKEGRGSNGPVTIQPLETDAPLFENSL